MRGEAVVRGEPSCAASHRARRAVVRGDAVTPAVLTAAESDALGGFLDQLIAEAEPAVVAPPLPASQPAARTHRVLVAAPRGKRGSHVISCALAQLCA